MFELYATGNYTFPTLADELNSRGVRIGALGKPLRPFTRFAVAEVLSNPVVTGTLTWRAKRLDGERRSDGVAPIVSPSTWQRVREIATGRVATHEKVAQRRHNYLFSSLARCGGCGESYWGRMNRQSKRHSRYAQILHAPRGCTTGVRSRNEERLSDLFGAWLAAWSLPADARTRIAKYVGSGRVDAGTEVRRRQLSGELDRLLKLYRWGDMGEDDYLRERRRVIRSLDALGPSQTAYEADGDALRPQHPSVRHGSTRLLRGARRSWRNGSPRSVSMRTDASTSSLGKPCERSYLPPPLT